MLQALVLTILYHIEVGRPERAFMLAGVSARMAIALNIHNEQKDLEFIDREVRRRLAWTLSIVDGLFSRGLPEYEVFPCEIIYVQLPCRENIFNSEAFSETETLSASDSRRLEGGRQAMCIRLGVLRRDIMRLTRQLALTEHSLPQLESLVQNLDKNVLEIGSDISTTFPYSKANLIRMLDSRWLPRFIAIHLSLHQAYCDLYRIFLPGYREDAPVISLKSVGAEFSANAAAICYQHARATIQILSDLQEHCKAWRLFDSDLTVCAYHTSRLVLFLAQSSSLELPPSTTDALNGAKLCLSVIERFFPTSAFSRVIVEELETLIARRTAEASTGQLQPQESDESVAQNHRHLAVYSLVRQSRFFYEGLRHRSPSQTPGPSTVAEAAAVMTMSPVADVVPGSLDCPELGSGGR